jgi:chemotaxis protein CheX
MLFNGVRTAALARSKEAGKNETGCAMAVSMRESLQLVSDPRNLDASVEEVFKLMLGVNCERVSGPVSEEAESVTAVVGFGGVLSGACVYRSGARAAMRVAALMTGMEFTSLDDTVKDAIGEIGNMLAGTWKGKVPNLAANCGLSVPAVITGSNYNLHVQAPEFKLHHLYQFEDACFEVTIICDGLQ